MVQAAPDEVLRAIGGLPGDLDWSTVAPNVLPVFPRRRSLPPEAGRSVEVLLPPGVMTGFGIDIGPAVLHIGQELLDGWPVDPAALTARALENLRGRTRPVRPGDLVRETVGGTNVRVLQSGWGWASTLILLEDELLRLFGDAPQRFIAPMRDLLVSLPRDSDPEFAAWLNEEFAALDPNALALEAFTLQDGHLRYETLTRPLLRA